MELIIKISGGYPYFVQFICREAYDLSKQHFDRNPGHSDYALPMDSIVRKLDADFFAGRWNKISDRQRELLFCVSCLEHCDDEFTIGEISETSDYVMEITKPFRRGDVAQMLPRLIDAGLVYKNRHGKYSLAVPLFSDFIKRQF